MQIFGRDMQRGGSNQDIEHFLQTLYIKCVRWLKYSYLVKKKKILNKFDKVVTTKQKSITKPHTPF